MHKPEPEVPPPRADDSESDLARRLALYRQRVAAEGRSRSLRLIDRAIEDADKEADGEN